MEMPTVTQENERLAIMAGSWTGKEIMPPSQWVPEKTEVDAIIENRIALNGFAMIQDYRQEKDGVTVFEGHGVLRWDSAAGEYVMHWFDSMGMEPNEFRGGFEGDTLTLISSNPMGKVRAFWNFGQADRYTYKMEMSPDGKDWNTMMEGEYSK